MEERIERIPRDKPERLCLHPGEQLHCVLSGNYRDALGNLHFGPKHFELDRFLGYLSEFALPVACRAVEELLRGGFSPHFTDSNPFGDERSIRKVQHLEGPGKDLAQRVSEALNCYLLWSYERLMDHPVNRDRGKPLNFLVTKWSGRYPKNPPLPFSPKYGLKGVAIENGSLYVGLARFLGLEPVELPAQEGCHPAYESKGQMRSGNL